MSRPPILMKDAFVQNCRAALAVMDSVLCEQLSNGARGGPFAAMLALGFENGEIEIFDTPRFNEVLASGIASRHAEHEALSPALYEKLVRRLGQDPKASAVILFSSAQSCTTCHTKQEIVARDLMRRGLIAPAGSFMTIYGATYDDTLALAGFNDKFYAEAAILTAEKPDDPANILRTRKAQLQDMPPDVRHFFEKAKEPSAILVHEGEIYSVGQESRSAFDLFATAEVMALRGACERRQREGLSQPWAAEGTLYSTNDSLGPLLLGEAGWTRVSDVVFVENLLSSRETPDLSNADFLRVVAGGYGHPQRAIQVFRDSSFPNEAQKTWAELLKKGERTLYNGAAAQTPASAKSVLTKNHFVAPEISIFL